MKNSYLRLGGAAVLALGFGLISSAASATTYHLQAASGQPQELAAEPTLQSIRTTHESRFTILNGQAVGLKGFPTLGNDNGGYWLNHIPVDATNTIWYAVPYEAQDVESRICTFYSNGNLWGCGVFASNGSASSQTVPSNGSAYVQSYLYEECSSGLGNCQGNAELRQVKVFD